MVAGILAANMSTLDAVCVYLSALVVRHLYKPFVGGKSQRHYVMISRAAIAGFLLLGICVSVSTASIIHLIKALPSLNIIFGAPILLILFWKRLTLKGVYAQVIACGIVMAILPSLLPVFRTVRQSDWLTRQTNEQTHIYPMQATAEDVANGVAESVGQFIDKPVVVPPSAFFYDSVARVNSDDPTSPKAGIGRLHTELVIADLLGVDLTAMTPSALLTLRYLIATILPFALLIPASLIPRNPGLEKNICRLYATMNTPVDPDPEKDAVELQKSFDNPTRFDHTKLFAHSDWEFCKWTRTDTTGFLLSTAVTISIIILFWGLIRVIA
jgi:hypothetical protein